MAWVIRDGGWLIRRAVERRAFANHRSRITNDRIPDTLASAGAVRGWYQSTMAGGGRADTVAA